MQKNSKYFRYRLPCLLTGSWRSWSFESFLQGYPSAEMSARFPYSKNQKEYPSHRMHVIVGFGAEDNERHVMAKNKSGAHYLSLFNIYWKACCFQRSVYLSKTPRLTTTKSRPGTKPNMSYNLRPVGRVSTIVSRVSHRLPVTSINKKKSTKNLCDQGRTCMAPSRRRRRQRCSLRPFSE